MYTVEALIPDLEWVPGLSRSLPQDAWTGVFTVPQLETDQHELQAARASAESARRFYVSVQIVRSLPGGERRIVR